MQNIRAAAAQFEQIAGDKQAHPAKVRGFAECAAQADCSEKRNDGGEGGIRTHVPAFGRQDAFEAPPL